MKYLILFLPYFLSSLCYAAPEASIKEMIADKKAVIEKENENKELKQKINDQVDGGSKTIPEAKEQEESGYVPLKDNGFKRIENRPPFRPTSK